jgi:hypothetical protein
MKSSRKPRRWRKDFPYYKIQLFNDIFSSWKDEPRAYDDVEEARAAIQSKFLDRKARIMVVERNGRHVLGD